VRISSLFFALPLGLALISISCNDEPSKPTGPGSVTGTITDIDSGAPVTDAAVAIVDPASMATRSALVAVDGDGRYFVAGLAPGKYSVVVYQRNFVIFDREAPYVYVGSGRTTTYDMRLIDDEPFHGVTRVEGIVRDANTGEPIAGAYVGDAIWGLFKAEDVLITLMGNTLFDWTVTDSSGWFGIDCLVMTDEEGDQYGLSPVSASKEGYAPNTLAGGGPYHYPYPSEWPLPLPFPTGGDTALTVEILLHKLPDGGLPAGSTGAIKGRAVFIDQPVANLGVAAAFAWTTEPDTFHTRRSPAVPLPGAVARTDAAGRFVVAGLARGMYSVAAGYLPDDGYAPNEFGDDGSEIEVTAGDTTDAGDIRVLRTMYALAPADGAEITDTRPALLWTAPALGSGYVLHHYDVWLGGGCWQLLRATVAGRSWQVPDSLAFARGGHGRWSVDAYATAPGDEDNPILVATFETAATFTVQ
jgi:hypothetical protein